MADSQHPPTEKIQATVEDGGDSGVVSTSFTEVVTPAPAVSFSPSSDVPKEPGQLPNRGATPPSSAIKYKVISKDTLANIAVRLGITTSELAKTNRISSDRSLVSGQELTVPETSKLGFAEMVERSPDRSLNLSYSSGPPSRSSPKPGPLAERAYYSPDSSPIALGGKKASVRIDNTKRITDRAGTVTGTLLVTSNSIMFQPSVIDPLVVEHGEDRYAVKVPMNNVANAALFYDVVNRKSKNGSEQQHDVSQSEIYWPPSAAADLTIPSDQSIKNIESDNTETDLSEKFTDDENKMNESRKTTETAEAAEPERPPAIRADEKSVNTTDSDICITSTQPSINVVTKLGEGSVTKDIKDTITVAHSERLFESPPAAPADGVVCRDISCSAPLSTEFLGSGELGEVELGVDLLDAASGSPDTILQSTCLNVSQTSPVSGYQNTSLSRSLQQDVSCNLFGGGSGSSDMSFVSPVRSVDQPDSPFRHGYDAALPEQRRGTFHGLPGSDTVSPYREERRRYSEAAERGRLFSQGKRNRASRRVEFKNEGADDDKELFLRTDKLISSPAKSGEDTRLYLRLLMCASSSGPTKERTLSSSSLKSYSKLLVKSEYWFSIPKIKGDGLISFLNDWAAGVYGVLDVERLKEKRMILLRDKKEEAEKEGDDQAIGPLPGAVGDSPTFSSILYSSLEPEMVNGKGIILNDKQRIDLNKRLPPRVLGHAWKLMFSSSDHGCSLQTLYRNMSKYDAPVLLVIRDVKCNIFGALTSCTIKASDKCYGTGQCWLYSFKGSELKVYNWTFKNDNCIKGDPDSLAFGAEDGKFGLWLDDDLYHGASRPCKTYDNEMLSSGEDFFVKDVEAWGFVEFDAS